MIHVLFYTSSYWTWDLALATETKGILFCISEMQFLNADRLWRYQHQMEEQCGSIQDSTA